MKINTVGSVCSGIEAASVAWRGLGFQIDWFSEIAEFPSAVLEEKYPNVRNLGDMNNIPEKILANEVSSPDLICGGTPCQAFSLAGWKNGLNDVRGNLTLKFVDIVDANDLKRLEAKKNRSIIFWENVEGVLKDRTNAFGSLISALAGLDDILEVTKWPSAGLLRGPKRNVAWRVLDSKYFGVPQQRKRLYLLAGGKDFNPESILFEKHTGQLKQFPKTSLEFKKQKYEFEVFREYTDCLYAAYGTKWNGNAAAYNGSLFVSQNNKIRRLSPLECERLMGFPDNYTNIEGASNTARYKAIGNSWVVPVIKWIGKRMLSENSSESILNKENLDSQFLTSTLKNGLFVNCHGNIIGHINCSVMPEDVIFANMRNIISPDAPENLYLSPVASAGILRRKNERNLNINKKLEEKLVFIASKMDAKEIDKRSRIQQRGKFSNNVLKEKSQHTIFEM